MRRSDAISLFIVAGQLFLAAVFGGRTAADSVEFDEQVAPVLIKRCLECHKGQEPSGGLSLESGKSLATGGDSGMSIVPGRADDSYLLDRVAAGEMPPPVKGVPQKLSDDEVSVLQQWIKDGAVWPEGRQLDLTKSPLMFAVGETGGPFRKCSVRKFRR